MHELSKPCFLPPTEREITPADVARPKRDLVRRVQAALDGRSYTALTP
jgi:hypothetical protein